MLIAPFRTEIDRLYDELLKQGTPQNHLDECVHGDTEGFRFRYERTQYGEEDDYYFKDWETGFHEEFFLACVTLKTREAQEYKKAMQWSAA